MSDLPLVSMTWLLPAQKIAQVWDISVGIRIGKEAPWRASSRIANLEIRRMFVTVFMRTWILSWVRWMQSISSTLILYSQVVCSLQTCWLRYCLRPSEKVHNTFMGCLLVLKFRGCGIKCYADHSSTSSVMTYVFSSSNALRLRGRLSGFLWTELNGS